MKGNFQVRFLEGWPPAMGAGHSAFQGKDLQSRVLSTFEKPPNDEIGLQGLLDFANSLTSIAYLFPLYRFVQFLVDECSEVSGQLLLIPAPFVVKSIGIFLSKLIDEQEGSKPSTAIARAEELATKALGVLR